MGWRPLAGDMGVNVEPGEYIEDGERGRALRSDARRNRMRVLEAAWRLLEEKRPEELSMEDVAREADLGKGTLYRHYPTRECLFEALVQEGGARLSVGMRDRIPPEADAPTKLQALVALLYDSYESHHINVDLLLAQPECAERAGHPLGEVAKRVHGILEQGVREGSFRPLDLDYTTVAVLTMVNPFAFVKASRRLGYTRAEMEERAVDLLLHALAAPGAV